MKLLLGFLFLVAAVAAFFYLGIWLCFIGGIMDIIEVIKANTYVGEDFAVGLLKLIGGTLGSFILTVMLAKVGLAVMKE
jgi:hypothetical protein